MIVFQLSFLLIVVVFISLVKLIKGGDFVVLVFIRP